MVDDSQFWAQIDHLTEQLKNEDRVRKVRKELCQTTPTNEDTLKYVRTQDVCRQEVLQRIESVIENVVLSISRREAPCLSYCRRNSWDSVSFQEDVGLEMKNDGRMTEVKFDAPASTNKFALMLKVLSLCYRLVQTNTFSTKRDLYYCDVQSFSSQSTVDDIIDNLCCLLQVPRKCLHVLATSKGLVYGDLSFSDASGSYVDCSKNGSGTQVPNHVGGITNVRSHAKFVLIIEKDATFQKIIDDGFMDKIPNCVIITGKGFPDINTRMMVRLLWDSLHIPVFALVDADPHGLAILFVYKFGSRSLSYESHSLTVPSIRWLGVLPSDVKSLRIPENALIPLSPSDLKKASQLMRRPFYKELPHWMSELQEMLRSGFKAEIQSLSSISENFLSEVYLPTKLRCGGWM